MIPALVSLSRNGRLASSAAILLITSLLGACADDTPRTLAPTDPSKTIVNVPVLSVNPKSVEFGNVNIGTVSKPQIVTVSNTGGADMHVVSVLLSGPNPSQFMGAGGDGTACSGSVAVPPGGSCLVSVVFSPWQAGAMSASLDITTDGGKASVLLTGTGFDPAPSIGVSPTTLYFGTQTVGTTSTAQQTFVMNFGGSDLTISSIALTGPNAGDFALTSGGSNLIGGSGPLCQLNAKVAPGGKCAISVTFSPTATGGRSAVVEIQSDGGVGSAVVSGYGAFSDLAVSINATPSPAQAGKPLTYTITISNFGPGASADYSLADVIPASTTFVSYAASPDILCTTPVVGGTGTVTCTSPGSIPSGSSRTVSLVVKALSGGKGTISNTVNLVSSAPDPVFSNNSATIVTTVYGRK